MSKKNKNKYKHQQDSQVAVAEAPVAEAPVAEAPVAEAPVNAQTEAEQKHPGNNFDLMEVPEMAERSRGGTELMMRAIYNGDIPRELLQEFQIIPGRVRDIKKDKVRLLYCHDLPDDPESHHLRDGGWSRFHRLVFVSNWQMQQYLMRYEIPWSKCVVMQNAIQPLVVQENKPTDKIRLVYHSTPHRGLNVLYSAFCELCKKHEDIELHVYSSFGLYGWPERDEHFKDLFKACQDHPKIKYYGAVDNETVRKAVAESHIFAYPSVWPETSCLCLMEAMSGANMCVHPNFAALFETGANWTMMYQFHEDLNTHANMFYSALDSAIYVLRNDAETTKMRLFNQKAYADLFYGWRLRAKQWEALLGSLVSEPRDVQEPAGPVFSFDTTRI